MLRSNIVILPQTEFPFQHVQLQASCGCVSYITVECASMSGITSTGSMLALTCSEYTNAKADFISYFPTVTGTLYQAPLAWEQPYPLPDRTNQFAARTFKLDRVRDINSFFIQLISDGTLSFDPGAKVMWRFTLYHPHDDLRGLESNAW